MCSRFLLSVRILSFADKVGPSSIFRPLGLAQTYIYSGCSLSDEGIINCFDK